MDSHYDPISAADLKEIVDPYQAANSETAERTLSGADVVEELGFWMESTHKLLRKLDLIPDPTDKS